MFLHGFLEDLSMWNSILDYFQDCQLLLIDLPGHGKSPSYPLEAYSMSFIAQKVNEVLDKEAFRNAIVVGHSLGGYVGLELMKLTELEKLVLFNSNFWADSDERRTNRNRVVEVVQKSKSIFLIEAIRNLFYLKSTDLDPVIDDLIRKATLMPVEEIVKSTYGLRDRKNQAALVGNKSDRIHIIHADNDPIISNAEMQTNLSKLTKKPEFYFIENSGHMSLWENPNATNRILKEIIHG